MFEAANIREWRGHDVVDVDGHKIGGLEAGFRCLVRTAECG
jgi:hypothetical protein